MKNRLINISWLDLKPNEIEYGNPEWFKDYYKRISTKEDFIHIPKSVFEQWIHPHHSNYETLSNYAWMDFRKITFELVEFSFETLDKVNVIEEYQNHVDLRGSYQNFEDFCCTKKDLEYWELRGTWREPPIILENDSLKFVPEWSEIQDKYQLVEGHSRLGYLKSMNTIDKFGKGKINEKHKIWLMKNSTQ